MNILILNSSPRKSGNTAKILRQIEANIAKEHCIEWIDISDLSVKPCMGCLGCRPNKECTLPLDDAQIVGRKILQADVVIIGTPTYWGNMTGTLKNLLDRNVTTFEDFSKGKFPIPRQKGKQGIIVTTSGAPWPMNQLPSQSRGTIRAVKIVLKNGGFQITGIINYGGTAFHKEIPSKVLQKATRIARTLKNERKEKI
jgi:multimeric flavodoxin WrbA